MEDAVDDSELITASLRQPIPDSNRGYQMLKRLGWGGLGLGRQEQGEHAGCVTLVASTDDSVGMHQPLGLDACPCTGHVPELQITAKLAGSWHSHRAAALSCNMLMPKGDCTPLPAS